MVTSAALAWVAVRALEGNASSNWHSECSACFRATRHEVGFAAFTMGTKEWMYASIEEHAHGDPEPARRQS